MVAARDATQSKEPTQDIALSPELYVRANTFVSRLVAGETIVLPVAGNVGELACFYSFNGTGTTIWEALEQPMTLKDLCDLIDRKYDGDREKAEEDVVLFVREICSLGLAKVVIDSENALGPGNDISASRNAAPE